MNGWKSMSFPARALLLLTWLISGWTYAQAESNESAPVLELLLFLGEWETDNGEWVDPGEFEDDSFEQLIDAASDETDE